MSLFLRLIAAFAVMMTASFAGCVLSAQTAPTETLSDRPVLRAVYGDFYPYTFKGQGGRAEGYSVDVIRQLADMTGYDVEFVEADNPQQFLDMLERGEVDLTPFLALTPERRAAGLATTPLGQYVLSVYVREDHEVQTIEALAGRRVGVVAGSIGQATADLLGFVDVVEYQTSDALLLPLLSDEIDAVVGVAETFEARLRANFIKDKVRRLDRPLTAIPYGIVVRRDLPQVHAALEQAIAQSVRPRTLATLRRYWFGKDRSIFQHPWFGSVATIVGGIAMSTVALGIYAVRLRRRSARLMLENSANQLLIDALDKMRAAIVIFDKDMKAKYWNRGFETRFAHIVPPLETSATLAQICAFFHSDMAQDPEASVPPAEGFAAQTMRILRLGHTDQRIVHTRQGGSFDLSVFPLGARYFAAIWVDVTELHSQQQHIVRQGHELSRKNQQLLAFSAMAAHDLKAPLMQQRALVDFITEDIADAKMTLPAGTESHFAMLSDLSGRMGLLVSDLLDFAKADSDQKPPQCFVPNTRLADILKLTAADPRMSFDIMPDMPAVRVEPTCFDMVMRNLISNAVKHHDHPAGRITLRAFTEGDQVVIEVEDDGPGIALKHQAKVFEPFARLTRVEGTGLGLAFVRKTVAAWGGSVSLRSAPTQGCIFSVSMPAAARTPVPLVAQIMPFAVKKSAGSA